MTGFRLRRGALLGAGLLLLVTACGPRGDVPVRLSGSSTIAPVAAEIAQSARAGPGLPPITVTGGGSGRGLADLARGVADIAMVSRPLGRDEQAGLFALAVARDRIAVVVHRTNPVRTLSAEALRAIYTGRVTRWRELGVDFDAPVIAIEKAAGRGTHVAFHAALGLGEPATGAAAIVGANAEVIAAVARTPGAVGYVSAGMLDAATAAGEPVRAVALPADLAARLDRPLLLVTRDPPGPRLRAVLALFCGADAARRLAHWGFSPVDDCAARLARAGGPAR